MTRDNLGAAIGSIAVGILGGMLAVEVIKFLSQKKCSNCNNLNENERDYCKVCGGKLQ